MLLLWDGVTPVQQGGLGAFIKARRMELGMSSQDDLAELAEVNQKKISQMERNANFHSPLPSPDIVAAVSRALRVSEIELIRAAGYLSDEQPVSRTLSGDAQIAELERIGREMGPEKIRAKLETLVESIMTDFFPEEERHESSS